MGLDMVKDIRKLRMKRNRLVPTAMVLLVAAIACSRDAGASEPNVDRSAVAEASRYLSPAALAVSADGTTLFLACATANEVAYFDCGTTKITQVVHVPAPPSGLALSRDGRWLYVTCAAPQSSVCTVAVKEGKVIEQVLTGHTSTGPVLDPTQKLLYVCNRFDNEVVCIDLAGNTLPRRVKVPREPVAAALTPDGKYLLVANHLQAGRADVDVVAASVSVIDTARGEVMREICLPNGSGLLRDVRISPDGRCAVVAHQVSRFHLPTTQVERGWINTSAISLIDLATMERVNTVLLDSIDAGAAHPWAVAWSQDGKRLCVTQAGTHELSVIDFPALLAKLARAAAAGAGTAAAVPNDLAFLLGLRQRIKLTEADRGPRSLVVVGSQAWVANYFSDTIAAIELGASNAVPRTIALAPAEEMTLARRGELLFNDATLCFQGWQSCSSCHSDDARVDGFDWDNFNDGSGNPKSAKSLLLAHETAPSMWLGVRANASVAVRAGMINSLFTVRPEEDALAIEAFLKSLRPIPSPRLLKGKLSPAGARGKELFFSDTVACAECHRGELYTDRKLHDVGTRGKFDQPSDRFDTPSLVEVWRTAPYLHDGRAASVREVITSFNPGQQHGNTAPLTPAQIDDLVEFVLSL